MRRHPALTTISVCATDIEVTYGQADEAEVSDRLSRHGCGVRRGMGVWFVRLGGIQLQRPGMQRDKSIEAWSW
jgi:hypothetical protein